MKIKHELLRLFQRLGYDISRFKPNSHPLARRKKLFEFYNIDAVIDIGANIGQFAQQLRRRVGYKNIIFSFEPLSKAFRLLKENSKKDPNWKVFNFALGDTEEKMEINIANNSYSSSLLDMLFSHINAAPGSKYIGKETIVVKKLDSFFNDLSKTSNNIYMKLDVQGFEHKVIKGAESCLQHIDTVQMEMSLIPLYEGELLFNEKINLMLKKGYKLVALENGFSDPVSGQVLQVDGIFHRFK
jgi:FkbM family methyltransferase